MDKSEIKKIIGTKYKHKGRTIEGGLDCVGLALLFHPELSKYDVYDYGEENNNEILISILKNLKKKNSRLQFGDILVFNFYNNTTLHVGIYVKDNRFLHVIKTSGVTYPRLDRKYKEALIGVYYG